MNRERKFWLVSGAIVMFVLAVGDFCLGSHAKASEETQVSSPAAVTATLRSGEEIRVTRDACQMIIRVEVLDSRGQTLFQLNDAGMKGHC